MTAELKVQNDPNLQLAGECFMYLLWVESTMIDFLTLEAGDSEMRNGYNIACRSGGDLPKDFAKKRLELSRETFEAVKKDFLKRWPRWENDPEVYGAIERAVIFRNAIGHAQVQLLRPYLLYTPKPKKEGKEWDVLNQYLSCAACRKLLKDCVCKGDNIGSPRSLKLAFRRGQIEIYDIIETIDWKCFLPTSQLLNVAYRGIAWPSGAGFKRPQNDPN